MDRTLIQKLTLPATTNHPEGSNQIDHHGSVVIVGANGAGKTRLGAWIELHSPHRDLAHRVAAQKILNMPISVSPLGFEFAESNLLYGFADPGSNQLGNVNHKQGNRWSGNPYTQYLNDFDRLMVYLFSEDYDKSTTYRRESQRSEAKVEPPSTKLDVLQCIWQQTLPHRELIIGDGKIETRVSGDAEKRYSASQMSDGERVVFYLIGQCLAAQPGAIIIIDEPEIHLHRSIQSRLWDAIELERRDCSFVYLTHDLDFAASRINAVKIWLKSFDGERWEWQEIPKDADIPEDILLSVLGSRRPILFVEGEKGSLDQLIYSRLYPGYTIVPCGGCEKVMQATYAFRSLHTLHALHCEGIIDRDQRSDDIVSHLRDVGIHVLDLSEIENLFLVEGCLRSVARHMVREAEADQIIEDFRKILFAEMEQNKIQLCSAMAAAKLEAAFKTFDTKATGGAALKTSLNTLIASLDVDAAYAEALAAVERIIATRNYAEAIKIFNNKGLVPRAGALFGMKGDNFRAYLKRLVSDKAGSDLVSAMQPFVPKLS